MLVELDALTRDLLELQRANGSHCMRKAVGMVRKVLRAQRGAEAACGQCERNAAVIAEALPLIGSNNAKAILLLSNLLDGEDA